MTAVAETMQVVACAGGGRTRSERRPVPVPGPGELTLALELCGLCGTDLFKLANDTVAPGTVLGHELVGTVAEVGAGVTSFVLGDRLVVPHHVACGECALCRRGSHTMCPIFKENLLAPGGFSERVLVRERAVARAAWRVPEGLDGATATFLEPAACVLRGLRKAALEATGGCAVVLGAGTMGLLHLLVLRATRPGVAVVVADPVARRQAVARELGAAVSCGPAHDELDAAVGRVSAGVGADAIFDTVGGAGPLGSGLAVCRPGGAVVLFAHAGEGETAGFELNPFFKSELRLLATYSSGVSEQRRVAELLSSGALDPTPLVSHRLPLSRFPEALALATAREAYKIVLEPDP